VERSRTGRVLLALLVLLLLVTVMVLVWSAPAASAGQAAVSASDRQLLIKVRQAGLWEVPAGEMAQEQAASNKVKQVGATIAEQHQALDVQVGAVARKLGVTLPDQLSEQQQGWLDDLATKYGPEFDRTFVQLVREAQGSVFPVVASVRVSTRNAAIREFAQKANDVVKTHMTLLEGTGQVNFDALPEAAAPGVVPAGRSSGPVNASQGITASAPGGVSIGLAVLLCLLVFGMTIGVLRVMRAR
jgi:putative membrane protein